MAESDGLSPMNEERVLHDSSAPRKGGRVRPINVAVAGGQDAQRSALKEVLSRIGDLQIEFVAEEAPTPKPGARAVILMVILDREHPDGWRREVRRHNLDHRFESVIALLDDDSPGALRAALRAGADDVLRLPPAPEQAYHSLLRMSELSHRHEGVQEKIVCSLVSVSGGVGVSHLSISLALALQRMLEKRTVVVELDLQTAPMTVLLNQEPEHTISELADLTSSVDSIRLESVLCKHESGLYWLAAPKRIEEAELVSAATVEATLKVLRELFDVVLIDCGTHLNESSIVAWERSDHLVYVIDQTVTAIRSAQRFLSLFQRVGITEVAPSFVVNRYQAASPITLERIETALGQPVYAVVPRDDKSCDEQQVTGQDLWKIRGAAALRESLEGLARKLAGGVEEEQPQRSLLSKLFGARHPQRGTSNGID
jgi:pilus assembly protein CpaE